MFSCEISFLNKFVSGIKGSLSQLCLRKTLSAHDFTPTLTLNLSPIMWNSYLFVQSIYFPLDWSFAIYLLCWERVSISLRKNYIFVH